MRAAKVKLNCRGKHGAQVEEYSLKDIISVAFFSLNNLEPTWIGESIRLASALNLVAAFFALLSAISGLIHFIICG